MIQKCIQKMVKKITQIIPTYHLIYQDNKLRILFLLFRKFID